MVAHRLKNNKGLTLVELMISLALLSILMAAAMKVINVNLRVCNKTKANEQAEAVADYILSAIENEVSNATAGATAGSGGIRCPITLGTAVISDTKSVPGIRYYDKDGRLSCIYLDTDTGELVFHKYSGDYYLHVNAKSTAAGDSYYESEYNYYGRVDELGNAAGDGFVKSDSYLPKENYKGFIITDLKFGTNQYYRPFASIFTVTITLRNEAYDIEYTKGLTMESYNGAAIKGPFKLNDNLGDTGIPESFPVD